MKRLRESQLVRYVMTGGMTTGVNYVIYIGLQAAAVGYLTANTVAWSGAVIFAYFANRRVVFRSKGDRGLEFLQFVSLRLVTLLVENLLLFILVDCVGIGSVISKIIVSVLTVLLNYFACKYSIFKERGVSRD